jgi:hypothetical protein
MQFVASFTFTQQTPSTTWAINHPLGCKPSVTALIEENGVLVPIIPKDIQYVDNSNLNVIWSVPRSGEARLV